MSLYWPHPFLLQSYVYTSRSLFESSNLWMDRSRNFFSLSIPKNLLPCARAAIPVVELPVKGSTTTSPFLVLARIILLSSSIGFCVGCLPYFFSSFLGVPIAQTERICISGFFKKSFGHRPFFIAS